MTGIFLPLPKVRIETESQPRELLGWLRATLNEQSEELEGFLEK